MSCFYEDAQQARLYAYVASQLNISSAGLDGHSFDIEKHGFRWRVWWLDDAPAGVAVSGSSGLEWCDIDPLDEPDAPDD